MKIKYLLIFFIFTFTSILWSQTSDIEKQDFLRAIEKRKTSLKTKQLYNDKLLPAIDDVNVTLVEQLLNNGADPNGYKNEGDISPLGLACNKGNLEIVKLLLEFGANPNYIPKDNMPALSYAVIGTEKPEIVKYLIYAGVDINYRNEKSKPVIYYAVLLGHGNVTKILYDNGADITFKDEDNRTLLDLAKRIGWKNIVEIFSGNKNITDMKKLVVISTDKLASVL
jgi:ankyrin repeat protein